MAGPFAYLAAFRRPALALTAAAVIAFPLAAQAQGRGPDKIADVAEAVIDAVVNISTAQTVTARRPVAAAGTRARTRKRGRGRSFRRDRRSRSSSRSSSRTAAGRARTRAAASRAASIRSAPAS